jgi:hypothetical protein
MDSYPKAAMERVMKVQDVMLHAMAKKIRCWQRGWWRADGTWNASETDRQFSRKPGW